MTNTINDGSYATYAGFDSLSYNCIKYLMDNDDVVWKLLKYKTPSAWAQSNLTQAEKASLIYNGSDDTSLFNVFLDMGSPDVITREDTILRISPMSMFPNNRVVGSINMMFEVYSHYHVNTLSNYKTRTDMITQRIMEVFNGSLIEGMVGKLFFDRMGSEANRMEYGSQIPHKGRWVVMTARSS